MKILVLDDIQHRHDCFDKTYPDDELTHVTHYHQCLEIMNSIKFDLVHLDHDLGDFQGQADTYVDGWGKTLEYTGQHVAYHICCMETDKRPDKVIIHSVNPVGSQAMKSMLDRAGISVTWEPFNNPTDANDKD